MARRCGIISLFRPPEKTPELQQIFSHSFLPSLGDYSLVPGTKMKRQHNAASTTTIQLKHMMDRLFRSVLEVKLARKFGNDLKGKERRCAYLTNGSLMACRLPNVYSL